MDLQPERDVFDREVDYKDFDPKSLDGKTAYVSTVRQNKMADLSLGSVFWLLKAAQLRRAGSPVVITDFYDKPGTDNSGVQDFFRRIGLGLKAGGQKAELRRAEDVPRPMDTWQKFCDYVRAHPQDKESWEVIGTVREGIEEVLEGNSYEVPQTMKRFLEELAVWVENIDGGAVQLMNHERETTAWMRRLYPEARKQFHRVALPHSNEYRRRYEWGESGSPHQITGNRLKDLWRLLAADPELEECGDSAATVTYYHEYYRGLLMDLINVIKDCIADQYGGKNYALLRKKLYEVVANIDPHLLPFCVEMEHSEVSKCNLFLEKNEEGTWPDWSTLGTSEEDIFEDEKVEENSSLNAYLEAVLEIGRTEIQKSPPCFDKFIALLKVVLRSGYFVMDDRLQRSLNTLLCDDRFPIKYLCQYWIAFLSVNSHLMGPPQLATPIPNKIATVQDLPEADYGPIRKWYEEKLGDGIIRDKVTTRVPIIKKVASDWCRRDPAGFCRTAILKRCRDLEPSQERNFKRDRADLFNVNYFDFMRGLFELYLNSGDTTYKQKIEFYNQRLSDLSEPNEVSACPGTDGNEDDVDEEYDGDEGYGIVRYRRLSKKTRPRC